MTIVYIAAGGSIGALLRYLISLTGGSLFNHHFPIVTLIANTLGCLIAGFTFTKLSHTHLSMPVYQGLVVGFLGALTTFSTYTVQSINYLDNGQYLWAIINVVSNVLFCFLSFYLGRLIAA